MIQGLRIPISGDELIERIKERVEIHTAALGALDARVRRRHGDLSFDCRADDLQPFGELQAERARCAARISTLTLLCDKIVSTGIYDLGTSDLRVADLIPEDAGEHGETAMESGADARPRTTIDGLKLTFTGDELRLRIGERIAAHRRAAERWAGEKTRTPESETDDDPILPDHICENEATRHAWRVEVLEFIRDHVEPAAAYRLHEADMTFAELLPSKPGWLEQEEYEERTSVGLHLKQLARRVGEMGRRVEVP